MIRLGTMLAGMVVMLAAGATAHAKMERRTFPVLARAGHHDPRPCLLPPDWSGGCTSIFALQQEEDWTDGESVRADAE